MQSSSEFCRFSARVDGHPKTILGQTGGKLGPNPKPKTYDANPVWSPCCQTMLEKCCCSQFVLQNIIGMKQERPFCKCSARVDGHLGAISKQTWGNMQALPTFSETRHDVACCLWLSKPTRWPQLASRDPQDTSKMAVQTHKVAAMAFKTPKMPTTCLSRCPIWLQDSC